MASAKQRAAAMRNLKKARAALNRKRGGTKRRRSSSKKRRRNRPVAKSNPTRRRRRTVAAKRRRAPSRRRRSSTRRRNPAVLNMLKQGLGDAAGVVAGKALARMLPTMIPQLPKVGPVGLAVQAAGAVLIGFAADALKLPRDFARALLAGGLSAPLETAAVAYRVPILGPALDPVAQTAAVIAASGGVSGYANTRRRLTGYAKPVPGVSRPFGSAARTTPAWMFGG